MKVVLSRIDERLIHGQVMTRWIKGLFIKRILVIDDKIARDDFYQQVLTMSAPTGIELKCLSAEDAAKEINKNSDDVNTLLLFKEIAPVKKLADAGYLVEELDIGNVGSSRIRKAITKQVFMSDEEVQIAKDLNGRGMRIIIQMLPTDNAVDLMPLI
ncbi:MAG: PTS sugar transporter subunit IIB [Erysipelotrichaceae bacterium]|nr:PTS sugar transporter subunit IIB [Erysipelotrichaceae bacterium]